MLGPEGETRKSRLVQEDLDAALDLAVGMVRRAQGPTPTVSAAAMALALGRVCADNRIDVIDALELALVAYHARRDDSPEEA